MKLFGALGFAVAVASSIFGTTLAVAHERDTVPKFYGAYQMYGQRHCSNQNFTAYYTGIYRFYSSGRFGYSIWQNFGSMQQGTIQSDNPYTETATTFSFNEDAGPMEYYMFTSVDKKGIVHSATLNGILQNQDLGSCQYQKILTR